MPNRRHSIRIDSVNPLTANLLAQYSARPGKARRALTEPMVTITGSRPSASRGKAARQTSVMAKTLISRDNRCRFIFQGHFAGSGSVLQPIILLDLPVKVRSGDQRGHCLFSVGRI